MFWSIQELKLPQTQGLAVRLERGGIRDGIFKSNNTQGCLGGSVVEHLPSAQVVIPGSWDRVPHWALRREPASPSACVSASLSGSLIYK